MKGFLGSPLLHLLLLAGVALASYSNTFHVPFTFDDQTSIIDNPVIRDLGRFLSGAGYDYNPRRFIGYLSLAVNYHFGGLDVTGYHLVNLAIHIISGWLVYTLVRLTFKTPFFAGTRNEERGTSISGFSNLEPRTSNLVPLLAALLFVAHPIQTQAVTYTVQRLASLATIFYLLSLALYIRARLVQETTGRFLSTGAITFYLFSLISAMLAMRTKEIAATLPLMVVVYEFSFFKGSRTKKLLFLAPILLMLLIIPMSILATGKPAGDLLSDINQQMRVETDMGRGTYLVTQFRVIATYLRLLFFPVAQNLDYDYPIYRSLFAPPVLGGLLLICGLIGLAVWLYRKPATGEGRVLRLIAFGITWFFVTLSIESSIIPIHDVIFEHRLYLPTVGAFLAVSSAALFLCRKTSPQILTASMLCATFILAGLSWARNEVWQDTISIWADTVNKSPRKARPHYNLGKMFNQQNRLDEAYEEMAIAVELEPANPEARNNLAMIFEKKGLLDEAIGHYRKAVEFAPGFIIARTNLGAAYEAKGLYDEAAKHYQEVIRLNPGNFEAHNNLGGLLIKTGRLSEAADELKTATNIDPGRVEALNNLGICQEKSGHLDDAIVYYQKALRIKPAYVSALSNLGNAFAKKGDMAQAINFYREAIRLKPIQSTAYVNLGVLFLKTGDIDKAVEQFKAAQEAVPGDSISRELLARTLQSRKTPSL